MLRMWVHRGHVARRTGGYDLTEIEHWDVLLGHGHTP